MKNINFLKISIFILTLISFSHAQDIIVTKISNKYGRINKGLIHGIKEKQIYDVKRKIGDEWIFVTKVKVVAVRERIAGIKSENESAMLKVGDILFNSSDEETALLQLLNNEENKYEEENFRKLQNFQQQKFSKNELEITDNTSQNEYYADSNKEFYSYSTWSRQLARFENKSHFWNVVTYSSFFGGFLGALLLYNSKNNPTAASAVAIVGGFAWRLSGWQQREYANGHHKLLEIGKKHGWVPPEYLSEDY